MACRSTCQNRPSIPVGTAHLKTQPFRLSRTQLAYLASEEFLRSFWWIVAIVPTFGVLMIAFGHGLMQPIGLFGIAWPFSVPARGVIATSKTSKLFMAGCYAEIDETQLTFYEQELKPIRKRWQIPLNRIRDIVERRGCYLIRTTRLEFIPVPLSAFETDHDRAEFVRIIAHAVEARLSAAE